MRSFAVFAFLALVALIILPEANAWGDLPKRTRRPPKAGGPRNWAAALPEYDCGNECLECCLAHHQVTPAPLGHDCGQKCLDCCVKDHKKWETVKPLGDAQRNWKAAENDGDDDQPWATEEWVTAEQRDGSECKNDNDCGGGRDTECYKGKCRWIG